MNIHWFKWIKSSYFRNLYFLNSSSVWALYGALGGNQNDASSDGTARQACKICPRAYANAGSLCLLWADKKAKQLDSLTNLSSPQAAYGRLATATLLRKQFSLYQHKRIKHPNAAFPDGAPRKGSWNEQTAGWYWSFTMVPGWAARGTLYHFYLGSLGPAKMPLSRIGL